MRDLILVQELEMIEMFFGSTLRVAGISTVLGGRSAMTLSFLARPERLGLADEAHRSSLLVHHQSRESPNY
jgi:hypothetical protein